VSEALAGGDGMDRTGAQPAPAATLESPPPRELALQAQGVTKFFGGVRVIEDIDFEVPVGERLAIIGPNGAGKTTLLNMINGQIPLTRGRFFFFGRDITSLPTHERAHIGQARSFQLSSLFVNLSAMENALLVLHGLRRSRYNVSRTIRSYRDAWQMAEQMVKAAGLWGRRDQPIGSLAYGDQRRLEIEMAMATQPKLLLLDEPSNGLTKEEGRHIIQMINEQIGRDVTVLVVAHDMELVFQVADRVMVLFEGGIIACDDCDVVRCDPRVKEIYMGA
jgi:branched-chain amino acid transport system ATP-binding protein